MGDLFITESCRCKPFQVPNLAYSRSSMAFSHCLIVAFPLDIHRLCGAIEARLSHILTLWLRAGWQSVIGQEKNP